MLVFRRDRDFRVVKRPSFVEPRRRGAHAERQTRVGRGLFERFGKLLHAAGAKNDGRHADALENADGGADVRAVRQMPLIVRQRKLRDDCASADVAERQHRRAKRSKGFGVPQIVERRVLVQPVAKGLLALTDVEQRDRPLHVFVLLIGNRRTVERNADRKRIELLLPFVAGRPVRRDRSGETVRMRAPQGNVVRRSEHKLRLSAALT